MRQRNRGTGWGGIFGILVAAVVIVVPAELPAQLVTPSERAARQATNDLITIARGQSTVLMHPAPIERLAIADPEVADAIVVSPQEVLVNAIALGTTSLIIWDDRGQRRNYSIEVTVDASQLQRTLRTLYPQERITVTAAADMVILTGTITTGRIARRVMEVAEGTGARVVDQLNVPPPDQILLQVRVAEVSRTAIQQLGTDIVVTNPQWLRGPQVRGEDVIGGQTLSDGLLNFFLINPFADVNVVIRALRGDGIFRSLAEPNLLALDGSEASFLAGGEFPFPVAQAGVGAGTITIEWREFGVRLNFRPTITAAGNIRLLVAPEVSQLDFTTGLAVGGFAVPSLLSRRTETEIELRDGQTFAIAGLLDNTMTDQIDQIPVLGDIPILGAFFRSRDRREERTELIVLVTPRLVQPREDMPPVPTGDPAEWPWTRQMQPPAN